MLRAGFIGFSSTGKTTLFQLMTRSSEKKTSRGRADANIGMSQVPDERLDHLSELFTPRSVVPATVEFTDTVGRSGTRDLLDATAFREAHALLHVIRVFHDETVPSSQGSVNPLRDAQAMEDELILSDLDVVERRMDRIARDLKKGVTVGLNSEQAVLERCKATLESGTPLRVLKFESTAAKLLRGFQFLSAKPLLIIINLDESDLLPTCQVSYMSGVEDYLNRVSAGIVMVSAKLELEIAQLSSEDANIFLTDLGLQESGLDRVIRASYELLGYLSFFTVGKDECRAWSIPHGTTAQAAAGQVHTDIARGFIRAETVNYSNLISRGSVAACREHGEVHLEGKDYLVRDGDVINFRFAT